MHIVSDTIMSVPIIFCKVILKPNQEPLDSDNDDDDDDDRAKLSCTVVRKTPKDNRKQQINQAGAKIYLNGSTRNPLAIGSAAMRVSAPDAGDSFFTVKMYE